MPIALVIDVHGGIGREVDSALVKRQWKVRRFIHRRDCIDETNIDKAKNSDCTLGNALNRYEVLSASQNVDVIVLAVNPPSYGNDDTLIISMLLNAVEAARLNKSRLVLPSTIYNFGRDAFPILKEDSPQNPPTLLGKERAQMEQMLADASIDVLIVRSGDYFGPNVDSSSWFSNVLVKPGAQIAKVQNPGAKGVGHEWAYMPDIAEAIALILESQDLGKFEIFNFKGHYDKDGTGMIEAIGQVVEHDIVVTTFPWWVIRLLSPFKLIYWQQASLQYLWNESCELDNSKLLNRIGAEPHTPLEDAIRQSLQGLGCI